MHAKRIVGAGRRPIVVACLLILSAGSALYGWRYAVAQNAEAAAGPKSRHLGATDAALQLKRAELEKPERAFAAPLEPYSMAKVRHDKDYYTKIRPARTWQHADPDKLSSKLPPLTIGPDSSGFFLVPEHTKLPQPLQVKALPGRPVTFTATDGGHFANDANSITVRANRKGLAQANFWVADEGDFYVWAGSPENAGPAQFIIQAVGADSGIDSPEAEAKQAADVYAAAEAEAQKTRAAQRARINARIEALSAER